MGDPPESHRDDEDAFPPESVRTHFSAQVEDAYAMCDTTEAERAVVPQREVMAEDPAIAPYLGGSGMAWNRIGLRRTLLAAGLSLVALLLFLLLPRWNLLAGYTPPAVTVPQRVRPYGGEYPGEYADRLETIHAEITAGNRWQAAYDKLTALLADAERGDIVLPPDIIAWARTEILVVLASNELAPSSYDEQLPDRLITDLLGSEVAAPAHPSFRALGAYLRVAGVGAGKAKLSRERLDTITRVVEFLRNEYPGDLDGNTDLLEREAEYHLAALPSEYTPEDRALQYHWRRAAHAIDRLYALRGARDPGTRSLDLRRWRAARRYFDLTLLTFDPSRIGWLGTVVLDGREYTRAEVDHMLGQLKG